MRKTLGGVLLVALLLPGPGTAGELSGTLGGAVEFDSNANRNEGDQDPDAVFRAEAGLDLRDAGDRWNWGLGYRVPFVRAVQRSEISDFNHLATGRFAFRPTARTEISGFDELVLVHGLEAVRVADDLGDPDVGGNVSTRREQVLRNSAGLDLLHQFSPRLRGEVQASHEFFDSNLSNRQEFEILGASGDVSYAFNARHRLGAGGGTSFQSFSEIDDVPASTTLTFNVFGLWRWEIDETTTLRVQGGPTWFQQKEDASDTDVSFTQVTVPRAALDTDDDGLADVLIPTVFDSCPTLDSDPTRRFVDSLRPSCGEFTAPVFFGETAFDEIAAAGATTADEFVSAPVPSTESGLTFFANVSLNRRWAENLVSAVSYRRQQSGASGLGGATVLNGVSASTTWRPSELWEFGVRGDFTLRQSISETTRTVLLVEGLDLTGVADQVAALTGQLATQAVDDSIDTQRWGVSARGVRRVARNTDLILRFSYNKQTSESGTRGALSDFGNILVAIGVKYRFDPVTLW